MKAAQAKDPLAATEMFKDKFADFQREQITGLVQRIYREVKKQRPKVIVSAAVFANDENAYTRRFQDWRRWLKMEFLTSPARWPTRLTLRFSESKWRLPARRLTRAGKKFGPGSGPIEFPPNRPLEKSVWPEASALMA